MTPADCSLVSLYRAGRLRSCCHESVFVPIARYFSGIRSGNGRCSVSDLAIPVSSPAVYLSFIILILQSAEMRYPCGDHRYACDIIIIGVLDIVRCEIAFISAFYLAFIIAEFSSITAVTSLSRFFCDSPAGNFSSFERAESAKASDYGLDFGQSLLIISLHITNVMHFQRFYISAEIVFAEI